MSDAWPFGDLERGAYGAILADPPWHFQSWQNGRWKGDGKIFTPQKAPEYHTMSVEQICDLQVSSLASANCILFCWGIWVMLPQILKVIEAWGFQYKTCAFNWIKADLKQIDMLREVDHGQLGLGYWVRQNSEFCLLATRGKPKRLNADVRQGIIAPRREHSRKPDGIHARIERLVAGPYVELFARSRHDGWSSWGNELDKFQIAASHPVEAYRRAAEPAGDEGSAISPEIIEKTADGVPKFLLRNQGKAA